jgi:uncharacterized protein (TIGR00251 family)
VKVRHPHRLPGDPTWWLPGEGAITVSLRVTPGGRRSEVIEVAADRMRVRVRARAVEGKANAELERFLAELFHVRRSAVTLVRGATSRDKTVRISGILAPPAELLSGLSPEP